MNHLLPTHTHTHTHTHTVRIYIVSLAAYVGVGELMLVGDSGGSVWGVSQGEGASVEKPFVARDPTAAVYVIQLPWAPGVKTNHPLSTTTTPSVTNKRFVSPSLHSPTATDHFSGSLPPPGSTYLPAYLYIYIYICIIRIYYT